MTKGQEIKKVVVLGGGTGPLAIIDGLKQHMVQLTVIVAMSDSGGSTGRLRTWYGLLPPGDLRNCISRLIPDITIRKLFQHRFPFHQGDTDREKRGFANHPVGNILIGALQRICQNDLLAALDILHAFLKIPPQHRVLPVTIENIHLVAEYADGNVIQGEALIDVPPPRQVSLPIKKLSITPEDAHICEESAKAIANADLIVIAPGSLYTSTAAVLLPKGMQQCLRNTTAKTVYVCNIMTQLGQTSGFNHEGKEVIFTAKDHLEVVQQYAGVKIDFIIYNEQQPNQRILQKYQSVHCYPVKNDLENGFLSPSQKLIKRAILSEEDEKEELVRHSETKLAQCLLGILDSL